MLAPTFHHLRQALPYLARVMELPLPSVQAAAAAIALLLILTARSLTR